MTAGEPRLYTDAVWQDVSREITRDRAARAYAAIAYLGYDAGELLTGLRAEDVLVCDASRDAVRLGLTSVHALEVLLERGIAVYSREGLHAKCAAVGNRVLVGSANASRTSKERRHEAVVAITSQPMASQLRDYIKEMAASPGRLLRAADLEVLSGIQVVAPKFPKSEPRVRPVVPPGVQVWLLPWQPYDPTPAEERDFEDATSHSATALRGSDSLDVVWWSGRPAVKAGDYVCWGNPDDRYIGPPHEVFDLRKPLGGRQTGIYYVRRGDLKMLPTKQVRDVFGAEWPSNDYEGHRLNSELVTGLTTLGWQRLSN
ncbi:phospholipase D-like domain-containing protein [Kribbella lupini]|uniref:Phospholipase D-like domain-containing protein n=1 Tax=Kribbella lupini TaxID=291602 RepID=A0ABN2BJT8_9ACTN